MDIATFIEALAGATNHQAGGSLSGAIELSTTNKITQPYGAVYGVVVELNKESFDALRPQLPKTRRGKQFVPLEEDWYPLYWGKDLTPPSRIRAHVQGHKNGNARLHQYAVLHNRPIRYGFAFVRDYEVFETLLHDRYPPILGSSRTGKRSTLVEVLF